MKTLTVIPTPIGNLQDVSDHMRSAMAFVDVVLCESIGMTKKLYQVLEIPLPKLVRYWQKTEQHITQHLEELPGERIGLVTDAGMPCISDPGYQLVASWQEKGWPVTVVPGPSALVVAVALSGIPAESFQFLGFLPTKSAARKGKLSTLQKSGMCGVIYESPHRIQAMCDDIQAVYGSDHLVCVMRELSKKFESYYKGSISNVIAMMQQDALKGEFCVVIHRQKAVPKWQEDALILRSYLSVSDCAGACAKIHGVSKSEVYAFLLEK
ncbi:16S rRNA (cytidine(1402)-2'-O)-methyltransferase [Candidatus Synchoanobacter obligatus]|uniref:16S rRNA (Cytidine(1402)-2'-O)-methyltransferase n=1 Tax=Candidatus Synchoanobacter obligatus TaxID=2919597 RepID=A0ABT1L6B1_9GAMM|nr:16S rRNA (cytidine(1402)-2'-O)-methyltransferase [Candidatus Synchoanobacter obligatus]MCP8352003.1 16S rRNA (cytidine(1402)-2'-O)-methyltransferase [Candidatus Synchoanobacter obligatus]